MMKETDAVRNENLLEVKDLKLSFRIRKELVPTIRDVSYTLKRGEVLGIVGESGSGKSISSNAILRLLPENAVIEGGQIIFDGQELLGMPLRELRKIRGRRISEIFQDPMTSLDPLFTIGYQLDEVLKKHTKMAKPEREARSIELLKLVGINQPERRLRQYPHEFSGGMRQRAMIAMALACDPELLIADEPTTALDVTIQAQIIDLLKELKAKLHTSIIFITHDLGVMADICDRVLVMYAGEIVESGDKRQIFYGHRHPYTEGLLHSIPAEMSLLGDECAFARRCPYAMKICARKRPEEASLGDGHTVRCWKVFREEQAKEERKDAD